MDGPEHYREAESLAGPHGEWYTAAPDRVPGILARAAIHAQLAQVAATIAAARIDGGSAVGDAVAGLSTKDQRAWDHVLDPPTSGKATR